MKDFYEQWKQEDIKFCTQSMKWASELIMFKKQRNDPPEELIFYQEHFMEHKNKLKELCGGINGVNASGFTGETKGSTAKLF